MIENDNHIGSGEEVDNSPFEELNNDRVLVDFYEETKVGIEIT